MPMKKKKENPFVEELEKCRFQSVEVCGIDGTKHKGICRAIDYNHLNVVLMTEKEKIVIKNMAYMKRKRGSSEKDKK